MYLSDWTRKVNIAGKVMCKLCNDLVNYGSGGKKDLKRHALKQKHRRRKIKKNKPTLSSAFFLPGENSGEQQCSLP